MNLTLQQIQQYSRCPKQLGYELVSTANIVTTKTIQSIVKDIIKQCYINRSQHSYNPEWDTIKARVNKECFDSININIQGEYQKAYEMSMSCLTILNHWYYKYFLADTHSALVNVPINLEIGKSIVNAELDVVLLDNKRGAIPIIFSTGLSYQSLYNNIETKGLLWLLYTQTNVYPKTYQYLVINDRTVTVHSMYTKSESIDTIGRYITHIVKSIEEHAFYPSVGSQCESCRFKDICTI